MSTLFRSRRQAEDLAARIDAPASVTALAADEQSERLLALVGELRNVTSADPRATPRPQFVADLRERLLDEAATVLSPQSTPSALVLPPRPHGRRERRLVAAATAAVLLGGTAGMAAAAQNALPGQALYPVKRGIEKVDTGLARSPQARGRDLLDQASGRLDEVSGLVAAGPAQGSAQIPATLATFRSQARQGAALLTSAYQRGDDPRAVETVRDFAARDQDVLTGLARTAPASVQPALRRAATTLSTIDATARSLCADCSHLPTLEVPADLVATAEADAALRRVAAVDRSRLGMVDNSHPVPVTSDETGGAPVRQRKARASTARGGTAAQQPAATATPSVPTSSPGAPGVLSGLGKTLTDTNSSSNLGSLTGSGITTKSGGTGSGAKGSKDADGSKGAKGATAGNPDPSEPLGDVVGTLLPEVGDAAGDLLGGN